MAETARIDQFVLEYFYSPITSARIDQFVIEVFTSNVPPPPAPVTPSTTTFRIRRERVTPTIFSDGKRVFHRRLQLDCQLGIGNAVDPGATPTLLVYTSDDGGVSWSQQPRELSPGAIGQTLTPMKLYQLGSAYNRTYKFVCESPNAWVIVQGFLDIDGGES